MMAEEKGVHMPEILTALLKNAMVGFFLTVVIALTVSGVKLIVVDALLSTGPKMPLIGIRWGLPEFILGGILGTIAARVIWQVYVGSFIKNLFNTG